MIPANGSQALMCTRWTDEDYIKRWGRKIFDAKYKIYGLDTIWGWDAQSGILPCRVRLMLLIKRFYEVLTIPCCVLRSTCATVCWLCRSWER